MQAKIARYVIHDTILLYGTKLHLNIMPYLVHVVSIISEPLVDSGDATLAARVIITDKLRAVLVDGIVGQMHTLLTLWRDREREGGRI